MTKFTETLLKSPVRLASNDAAASTAHAAHGARPLNILIVDHDRDCTDAFQMLLSDMPHVANVAIAPNFDVALSGLGEDACALWQPDVIFIDPQPRVDRMLSTQATLRALRQQLPSASIVLLSVYSCRLSRNLHGLADHVIQKDVSRYDLRALIDSLSAEPQSLASIPAAG